MKKINFTKMVASGNDFIIVVTSPECRNSRSYTSGSRSDTSKNNYIRENQSTETRNLKVSAKQICDRKFGVGADGLLILEKSKLADIKMRIFNADGSEAQMCGNGARCVALYTGKSKVKIETKAGIIESQVNKDSAKVKLTDPKDLKLDIPLTINCRTLRVNFINTGVPHTVIFVEGLDRIDVFNLGRQIRYHKRFAPAGTNVDFIEVIDKDSIKIRTYERGVEDETLACGTGAVAGALITSIKYQVSSIKSFDVCTRSREMLKVYFERKNNRFKNVWLEGKVRIIYKGVYNV